MQSTGSLSALKKLLLVTGAILLFFLIARITLIILFCETSKWYYAVDFDEYGDSFEKVRDYIESENLADSESRLSVGNDWHGGRRLYAPERGEYLELPDDVADALLRIDMDAFPPKASFETIRLEDGRISFCLRSGDYSLVWSPNGKPTGINSSDDDEPYCIKKIGGGWYHMASDPYR